MHTNGKWLVRGGALLILFGFFMPSVLVSCTAMPTAGQTISLSQLANDSLMGQPLLYLVLLGAIAAIAFAFLPASRPSQQVQFLMAQILGLGLGALSIIFALISLSTQMEQIGFSPSLAIGFYVLFAGYGVAAIGVVMQFQENARMGVPFSLREAGFDPPRIESSHERPIGQPTGARLEITGGKLSPSSIPIYDGFILGRGKSANLPLPDRSVSAQHARLRFAQGVWFIQDQSMNGTFVNGEQVSATRLNSGDEIRIGDTTFIFRV
jgi:hypothetical protein